MPAAGLTRPRTRVAWPRLLLLCCVAALGATGCRQHAPSFKPPRLVILYTSCTVNRSYTAAYDPAVEYTPSFARFAQRASVFDKHHTESGQSGIAFASLFTGAHADVHGIFKHPRKLAPEVVVVPEVFAAGGYDTHSWLVQTMASSRLDYAQGVPPEHQYLDGPLVADSAPFKRVLDRLASDPDYRAFLVTNFTVTHGPYEGTLLDEFCTAYPAQCRARGSDEELAKYKELNHEHQRLLSVDTQVAIEELGLSDYDMQRLREVNELLYKADMYRLDKMFGGVVAAVEEAGLFDDAVIAFTSDHGELLWRDNALFFWTHGYQQAPEVINIALMLSGPNAGVPPGRYRGVSRSIDVLPTLAGLAGLELPSQYVGKGVDLSSAVRGLTEPPDLIAMSHSALLYAPMRARRMKQLSSYFPGPDPEFMWVSARRGDHYFKLRRRPDGSWYYSMYDLGRDPEERRDILDSQDPSQAEILAMMEEYKAELSDAAYRAQTGGIPREQAIRMLRSMGYID